VLLTGIRHFGLNGAALDEYTAQAGIDKGGPGFLKKMIQYETQ
jgi:hypothetical protein